MANKNEEEAWRMKDYFHGNLRREFVEDRLETDGDFLIRKASNGMWCVSVRWKSGIYHIEPIQDGKFYRFGELKFESYNELVKTHFLNGTPISVHKIVLKKPVAPQKVHYKRDEVAVTSKLGEGTFAEVFKVKLLPEGRTAVMKVLKSDVDAADRETFELEMNMMLSLRHRNVVSYLGLVDDLDKVKLLLELANRGSLDSLLTKRKLTEMGKLRVVTHVSRGLKYLHGRQIVHRDLAARNVLVHRNDDGTVAAKVADFGLSREEEEGHRGYELKNARKLPVRWMAPECIKNRHWTKASDVWSYGVLMWEVFTNGGEPYGHFAEARDTQALTKYIAKGGHPCELKDVNADMQGLMLSCWTLSPEGRPIIGDIVNRLEQISPTVAAKMIATAAKSAATFGAGN